ncbi:MFS transporter [Cognatishimia activa]|uniref:Metal-tetracycline/H(+) antiporter n=1 Tax=Cognatishimia activa TaxID=1715691 RepID=A0A0P1ITH9_9RHOB|nr:MFS transporter [Cognatishimia activa]CUI26584.1 Metal-tetracycline/H(+) antiporter [Cognatishimia activa]CUK25169.1 Metal-tetracycline/H(+) antiporter [Cognatishimia activa]
MTNDGFSTKAFNPAPGLLLAATLLVMAAPTVSPALPGLAEKFKDTPYVDLITRYLVAAPSLMALLFAPFAGALSDRIGHGRVLRIGVLIFGISGIAGLFLQRLDMILLSRFFVGVGLAMAMTSQNALIGQYYQGNARQQFLGWQVSARNFSGLFFVLFAGYLAVASPHYPFAVYGLTFLFIPFIWRASKGSSLVPPIKQRRPRLSSPWLFPVYWLCILQIITLALFFIMPSQIPFALRDRGFTDPTLTGHTIGTLMIAGAVAGALYGKTVTRFGVILTIAIGFACFAAGFATLLAQGLAPVFIGPALISAGYALLMASNAGIALSLAPQEHRGFVMGLSSSAIFFGQSLSPLISTPIIKIAGFPFLFSAAGVVSLAGAAIAVFWPKRQPASAAN